MSDQREGRPADNGAAISESAQAVGLTESSLAATGDGPSARVARRDFWREVDLRRRWARALDDHLAQVCPPPEPRRPSTFGLSPEDVRAEFDRLVASGWTPGEVRAVLAVSVPERAR